MLLDNLDDDKRIFCTVKGAADRLEVHPDTIRRWADKEHLPSFRHPVNNYRVFFIQDLEQMKWKIILGEDL